MDKRVFLGQLMNPVLDKQARPANQGSSHEELTSRAKADQKIERPNHTSSPAEETIKHVLEAVDRHASERGAISKLAGENKTAAPTTSESKNSPAVESPNPNHANKTQTETALNSNPGVLPDKVRQAAAAMLMELDPSRGAVSTDPRVNTIRDAQLDRAIDYKTVEVKSTELAKAISDLKKDLQESTSQLTDGKELTPLKQELLKHLELHNQYGIGLAQTREQLLASIKDLNHGLNLEAQARKFEQAGDAAKAQTLYREANQAFVQANEQLKQNPLHDILTQLNGAAPKNFAQNLANQILENPQMLALGTLLAANPQNISHPIQTNTHPVSPILSAIPATNANGQQAAQALDRTVDSIGDTVKKSAENSQNKTENFFSQTTEASTLATKATLSAFNVMQGSSFANQRANGQITEQITSSILEGDRRRTVNQSQQQASRLSAIPGLTKAGAKVATSTTLDLISRRVTGRHVIGGALSGAIAAIGLLAATSASAVEISSLGGAISWVSSLLGAGTGATSGFSLGGASIAGIGAALGGIVGAAYGTKRKR